MMGGNFLANSPVRYLRKLMSLCGWLLPILPVILLFNVANAQAGGHTLLGDLRIDEGQSKALPPLFLQVVLYSEDGRLLSRQTIASNGRYRFHDLRNGRY